MERKDFIKLRCKIHQDFQKWFSYSRRFNCLYSGWCPTPDEERNLVYYVSPDFAVMFVPPCSTFIFAIKK